MRKLLLILASVILLSAGVASAQTTTVGQATPGFIPTPANGATILNSYPWAQVTGQIQTTDIQTNFNNIFALFTTLGTWSPTGVYSPNIASALLGYGPGSLSVGSIVATTGCASIEAYGGVSDGVTDNTSALARAYAAAKISPFNCINFGPGNFYFASTQTFSLPANGGFGLYGAGAEITTLTFPAGVTGFVINQANPRTPIHVRDLSEKTQGQGGTAVGFNISMIAPSALTGDNSTSDFTNVNFGGSTGYTIANGDYWFIAIEYNATQNFIHNNVNIFGPAPTSGGFTTVGLGVVANGNATATAGPYTFNSTSFNYLGTGFTYGTYVQGVSIGGGSSFGGGNTGISVPAGEAGLDQLTVTQTSFETAAQAIVTATAVPGTYITNNFFVLPTNSTGVNLLFNQIFDVSHNQFNGFGIGTGETAVHIGTTAFSTQSGTVTYNYNTNLQVGVSLDTGSKNIFVQGNDGHLGVNTPVVNVGTANIIKDNPGYNPVGPTSLTPGGSPWTYTAGASPETVYISATTAITGVAQNGISILPAPVGSAVPMSLPVNANDNLQIFYTGTLIAKKMVN